MAQQKGFKRAQKVAVRNRKKAVAARKAAERKVVRATEVAKKEEAKA